MSSSRVLLFTYKSHLLISTDFTSLPTSPPAPGLRYTTIRSSCSHTHLTRTLKHTPHMCTHRHTSHMGTHTHAHHQAYHIDPRSEMCAQVSSLGLEVDLKYALEGPEACEPRPEVISTSLLTVAVLACRGPPQNMTSH